MHNFSKLISDEVDQINRISLSESTKVGQVYCYLSAGPVPMIKIGKGKNGRQRMATWIQGYPPTWYNDNNIVFVIDKVNQSTSETAFHRHFQKQRVSPEEMRLHMGIADWQRLPDGATEWFYCDTFVKESFRSVGIDLVQMYRGSTSQSESRYESWFGRMIHKAGRAAREFLGWTTFLIMGIMVVSLWGNFWAISSVILGGLFIAGTLFPDT